MERDDAGQQPEEAAASPATDSPEGESAERLDTAVEPADADGRSDAERERDEYLELAQRTKAEFDNYRKRVAKETSEAALRG